MLFSRSGSIIAGVALFLAGCSDSTTAPATTGNISVIITGLPVGALASVSVTGPAGFTATTLTASQSLNGVPNGSYTITPASVTVAAVVYRGSMVGGNTVTVAGNTLTVNISYGTAPTRTVTGTISANTSWSSDTVYIIRGFVYVASGANLTIQDGTKIVGDTTALGSALFVLRGARLTAIGTAARPIVFTSQRSAGNRQPGDWGGLILVGNARSNRSGSIIVEGSNGSVVGADPAGVVYSGGTTDADNSGTLQYVRVEFAGYATLTDAELNSYSFAAVGSGTTMDHLESLMGLDDSFEWWGGAVNARYLVSYESGDDHFDTSEGFRGKVQFLIGLQSGYFAPRAGAGSLSVDPQGFEVDGCSGTGCVAPVGANAQSAGRDEGLWNMNVFANFTLVGTGATPVAGTLPANGGFGAVLRRGTGGVYMNGVLANWPRAGVSVRDTTTDNRVQVDSLMIRNVYYQDIGAVLGSAFETPTASLFGSAAYFTARSAGIEVSAGGTTAGLFTAFSTAGTPTAASFDWTPAGGSPIATGGLTTLPAAITARAGAFITPTAYRGAADPAGGATKWWSGWTYYARN